MKHPILLENQNKRFDRSLWQLVCFAMFNFWQMGFVYYFLEPSSAIDGKIPIPIDVDNMTLLVMVCYILSILIMILLPRTVVWLQRIATGVALVSAVCFFLPLPEDIVRHIIYLQVFSCCLIIGFETFLVVNYFTESSSIKYLTFAYGVALFLLALVQNELIPVAFSTFRYWMLAALVLLFTFFLRIPTGKEHQPRYIKKSDGIAIPKKLLCGALLLVFISGLMAVSGPAITGKVKHGVTIMYLVEAAAGFVIYLLYRLRDMHPFRLIPALVGLGGIGFLLMLAAPYAPVLAYIACGLIGLGMVSCYISPLYGVVLMKIYPSKYIPASIIGLALVAVLIHSGLAEIFLGVPVALYFVYAVIMAVLVFLFTQLEPFLMFALRRRITDEESEAPNAPAQEPEDPLTVLSKKEREVAELICLGYTNKDIAKVLFITEHTVKDHTKSIYRKTDVHSRMELAALVSNYRLESQTR